MKTVKPAKKIASAKKAAPSKAPKKTAAKKTAAKKTAAKKTAAKKAMHGRRADFGAPIDAFFARQPPHLRPILEALRALVEETLPDASATIKWGMPFYTIDGAMTCALAGHKSHVGLIVAGPPDTFDDPEGRLEGDGKTGKRLVLRSLDDLPRDAARGWLLASAAVARRKGRPA